MDVARFKNKYMGSPQKLYYVAYRLLENEADAQDAVQETYTRLWGKRAELESVENGEAYAIMMLRNLCIDQLRMRNVHTSESISSVEYKLSDNEDSSHRQLENREELGEVERALQTLPLLQQEVMRMRHWCDLSIEEIERSTGLTAVNVRVLLSRGRKKIKEILSIK